MSCGVWVGVKSTCLPSSMNTRLFNTLFARNFFSVCYSGFKIQAIHQITTMNKYQPSILATIFKEDTNETLKQFQREWIHPDVQSWICSV